jgi:hypothetical protein
VHLGALEMRKLVRFIGILHVVSPQVVFEIPRDIMEQIYVLNPAVQAVILFVKFVASLLLIVFHFLGGKAALDLPVGASATVLV